MRWRWCLLWFTGCTTGAPEGQWSDAAVMEPHLQMLDRDRSGSVDAAEYERARWNGPPFATADRDRSGTLDADELARLVRGQSPSGFDGLSHSVAKPSDGTNTPRPLSVQHDVETLLWLHTARISSGDPGLPAPLRAAVEAAQTPDDPSLDAARTALGLPTAP